MQACTVHSLITSLLAFVVACSSGPNDASGGSGGNASSQGGSTATQIASGGSTGVPGAPLFSDAPDCGHNGAKLEGTFQGMTVNQDGSLGPNTLEGYAYYTVEVAPRSDLRLQWKNVLEPNVVQPLTGGYFLTKWDTANRDVLYCIVAGEIGALATERSQDDYLKFSITRARAGEVGETAFSVPAKCDGDEIDVDLKGCVFRYAN